MFETTPIQHRQGRVRRLHSLAVACAAAVCLAQSAFGQLIYQEDFETDGEAASPKRYTTTGRDVYEVDRIRAEIGNQDQLGPIYWAHNSEVSYAGVPAPTPARRMAMAWDTAITSAEASPEVLRLFDSSIKWLLNGKAGAKIVVNPSSSGLGVLGEQLTAAGHTLVDDDISVPDEKLTTLGDALIHVGGGSRGARAAFPMLIINSSDADDVLTSSIGTPATFEAGKGTVAAPTHPAAGGLTGDFVVATGPFNYQLLGEFLPANPTILATFTQPGDPAEIKHPFIMLLNGPNDNPAGTVFGGGPFTGQSGKRFYGGAGMNKWTLPESGDRTLTLNPVNVAGKSNLKLTIALAGTFLDFEQSNGTRGSADYLEVAIDPDGNGPKEFQRLMFFTPPSGSLKYVDDATTNPSKPTRLGLEFKDVTYDIPPGATDLVVEVRCLSTWWNEIFAFDNIRIHSGNLAPVTPPAPALGGVESVKLTHVVPDTILFKTDNENLDNWEPYASVLGNSTFLVEANTFAAGTADQQRFALAFQPVAGGAYKTGEAFFTDAGKPFTGAINASRQNGNPGRVAGDTRPGAVNFMAGGEASPHTLAEFGEATRWGGFNRLADGRYGTVQTYSLDIATLAQKPLSKAQDSANGRVTSGEAPGSQITRFGGDIVALDNGNFVSVVEDRSKVLADPNQATVTIFKPDGSIVKESFSAGAGDLWANVAAFKGGFAVRVAGVIHFFDNAGNETGTVDPADSSIAFDRGRGDGTRMAGHINSPFVYLSGTVTDAKEDGTPIKVPYLAAFDSRDKKFAASVKVGDIDGDSDRVNLAVDALNRVTVAYEGKPAEYEQTQMLARVFAYDAAGKKFTALTPSFFPFKNNSKSGITVIRPSVAVTTKQILIAAKGTLNSQNKPDLGPDTAIRTTVYAVISHPAPADDPTPPASTGGGGAAPRISFSLAGGQVTLTWDGGGTLESASAVTGPWTAVAGAASGYKVNVSTAAGSAFFRVRQ